MLEHHSDVSVFRFQIRNVFSIHDDSAGADLFESGQTPKKRTFSASGRSEQCHKLSFFNVQADIFQYLVFSVKLVDILKLYVRHLLLSPFLAFLQTKSHK